MLEMFADVRYYRMGMLHQCPGGQFVTLTNDKDVVFHFYVVYHFVVFAACLSRWGYSVDAQIARGCCRVKVSSTAWRAE